MRPDMISNCELPVVHYAQKNLEGIAKHLFSANGELGCQAASAPSRLKKAVSQLAALRVNRALAEDATTSSSSVWTVKMQ